jgi:hypothetical protein
MKDMRLTQAKALQDQHMSLDEYRFMVTAVYLTWATKVTKDVAPMMDSAAEGLKKSIGELDKQIADSNIPESAKEQLKKVEMRCSLNLIQYRKM